MFRPAVDGTVAVMTAAVRAGVKRVVVTSSTAAVYFQGNGEAIKAAGEGKEANENNEVERRGWETVISWPNSSLRYPLIMFFHVLR